LEGVFLEKVYIVDSEDEKHTYANGLRAGMTTYRFWVDMAEGYKLLSVYGTKEHPLVIQSTEPFYNDTLHGKKEAPDINPRYLGNNGLLLDSYVAFSGATQRDLGVLKVDDTDGSVVKVIAEKGAFDLVERGILLNRNPEAGIPLREADGIMDGAVPALVTFGSDFAPFGNSIDLKKFELTNGAWAVFKGLQGPYKDKNYILIAQVTTAGALSYKLNLQLASPDGNTEYYVAENPVGEEKSMPQLIGSSDSDQVYKSSIP
jgi:hypothetical protein